MAAATAAGACCTSRFLMQDSPRIGRLGGFCFRRRLFSWEVGTISDFHIFVLSHAFDALIASICSAATRVNSN